MSVILETTIEGQCSVKVRQQGKEKFSVEYGKQVVSGLTYTGACKEYGECVFHALTCAGMID